MTGSLEYWLVVGLGIGGGIVISLVGCFSALIRIGARTTWRRSNDRRRLSRDLPPYWAIMAVDAKDFSGRPSVHQSQLSAAIRQVLDHAFGRAAIGEVWQECSFRQRTGDGYVLAAPVAKLPYLLDPLLSELQAVLEERDHGRLARDPRLRLRVSLNVGPLPDHDQPGAGVGQPMTETHRLLDTVEVRRALARTDERVTFVAAIISQRVYVDVVLAGYAALHPAQFARITARSKKFEEQAYLHIPKLSGRLLASGLASAPGRRRRRPSQQRPPGVAAYSVSRGIRPAFR